MPIFVVAALVPIARGAEWKDALKEKIESQIKLTKIGIDRIRITQPGTLLIIKKDGISGDLATDATFSKTMVEGGEIKQPKGITAVSAEQKDHPHV